MCDTLAMPYAYPSNIAALNGRELPAMPGWTISLPFTPDDLRRNADHMSNCTFTDYESSVRAGRVIILVLQGPEGTVNAAIRTGSNGYWKVEQVAGRFNERVALPHLQRVLNQEIASRRSPLARIDPFEVPEPPLRRCARTMHRIRTRTLRATKRQ